MKVLRLSVREAALAGPGYKGRPVVRKHALPRVPGITSVGARPPGPSHRWHEYEFREYIERISEVCWEATRAHIRSEFDSRASIDPTVPVKWTSAKFGEQQATRVAVLSWWNGSEDPADAPTITHVCRAIVLEYKRQWEAARK